MFLNGIPDFTERPDLLDRSLTIQQPVLETKKSEKVLETGAVAPVPRISTKSGPFSPGEWLESLPGSARGY